MQHSPGLWSRSRDGLETYQRLVSRKIVNVSVSEGRRLGLGHLRFVPKTNFRPNCAGHINKTSQFWAPRECFTFTAASTGSAFIHVESVTTIFSVLALWGSFWAWPTRSEWQTIQCSEVPRAKDFYRDAWNVDAV